MSNKLVLGIIIAVIIVGVSLLIFGSGSLVLVKQVDAPVEDVPTSKIMNNETEETETPSIQNGLYALDTESSSLEWSAERIVGGSHEGKVLITKGEITAADGGISAGSFTVNMSTISESAENQQFLSHIRSDDFFSVEEFPASEFTITTVEKSGSQFTVRGDLTIKGKTNSVSFPASVSVQNGNLRVTANFSIDRTLWGVNFGSGTVFQQIGDKAIRDEIEFRLSLLLVKS